MAAAACAEPPLTANCAVTTGYCSSLVAVCCGSKSVSDVLLLGSSPALLPAQYKLYYDTTAVTQTMLAVKPQLSKAGGLVSITSSM